MLILTKEDIKKVFSMTDAIQASQEALCIYSEGKCVVPLRTSIDIPKQQGQSLFMPAYIEELNVTGIKIVSIYPMNIDLHKPSVSAQMILLDGKTGEPCAMMDGTYLTQLRTGALQGVATNTLARQDAKIAVLIGTGGQAGAQLEAMLNVRNLKEVRVLGTHFGRAKLFAATMQKELMQFNTKIFAVENRDEAIKDADIITTVTNSKEPVFNARFVKKGTHINGIGSYLPDMQELPESLIKNADKIIFDTREGVLAEAGDILIPMKLGMISETDFEGELGEVLLGKVKGRETEQEITIFKSVGTAILDVVTAYRIYMKALEMMIGKDLKITD